MPIFVNGHGGGSSSGYKYHIGSVISPTINNTSSGIELKWQDPDDIVRDGKNVEWKGTVVVANSDHKPASVYDGNIVADVTTKNAYRSNPLVTSVGGVGYYYGIFPYTKDYVVNTDEDNIIMADGGLFQYVDWSKVKEAIDDGTYKTKWKVGDTKKLRIKGNVFGQTVDGYFDTMILGFDHDFSKSITFIIKEPIASVDRTCSSMSSDEISYGFNLDAVDREVISYIKPVAKDLKYNGTNGSIYPSYNFFCLAYSELFGSGYTVRYSTTNYTIEEGNQYEYFKSEGDKGLGLDISSSNGYWLRSLQTNNNYNNYGFMRVIKSASGAFSAQFLGSQNNVNKITTSTKGYVLPCFVIG